MSDIQEYPDVVQEFRGHLNPGRLKLQSNSVIFKNTKTGKVDQYQSSDITKAEWLKRARGYCLKIKLNNDTIHRYDGFKETDFEKLSGFVSNFYNTSLEKVDVSLKGWNYGIARFLGNALTFEVDKSMSFEVPLTNVSHSTTAKNEVTLEFHLNDDAAVSLTEMRFHIPADANRDSENDPVQEFYKNVMESADIIQATGESIVTLQEIQCLTPRGRYDLKMYPTFLQLHGKTFDYKIPYTTVLRLFLLPHKDGRQMFFVVSLDPPIKQGQTRYHFLILLFNKDDEMTAELNLTDEDIEKKYDGKLTREMSGPDYEVVSKIFKAITTSKITVPGGFVGHSGTQAIGCSYKAATGLLYPLERGFIFVHKPPIHIRFDEIAAVNFARSSGNTRSFDFDVESKSGTVYNFVGLEKDEYGKLYDFVAQKKLRVKNIGGKGKKRTQDDDDWGSGDEGGEHDAYLERMKEEGKNRQVDDEDDDSDSSDESYNPGGSGSEVAEEYDSNPPTSSTSDSDYSAGSAGSGGDSEAEARREKKKEKREKKEKKKSKSAKTVKEGRRKRRSKKDRDPNRPKRAQSAYFLWLNESRESIKTEFPGLSITELSKKAGEMWRDMTDKSKWEALAEEAKKEYQAAMEEYKKQKEEEPSGDDDDDDEEGGRGSPKKEKKEKVSPSPKKQTESRAGAGSDYKSKEFISSSSSSDEDKPLKKKAKKEGRKEKRAVSSPKGRKSKRGAKRNSGSESEEAELPEDEEILSSPTASEASGSESDSD
ncbi:FACT complex subunit SSRP1-like [Haliotis rubra]|uniref:FACT complex subunit SSRP1-like n=1 Tax=Haliotis rubra TaxID=36100 RepID=UPI001EE518C8|nr:FACT complex subunit SSRP1-like [Haliotis rubra]